MRRRTRGTVALLAALVVTIALGLASSSASALVYGIQGNAIGYGYGYFDRFADLGVTHAREEFDVVADPAVYDRHFTAAANAGVVLLPLIDGGSNVPAPGSPEATTYAAFVRDFVARFGPHGVFWSRNPTLPQRWPTHFDLWNEPYSGPIANAGAYASLFVATVRAARTSAGNPAARFLLEADLSPMAPGYPGCVGGPASGEDWIGAMYAAEPSLNDYVDGFSIHPYGNDPATRYDPLFADCGRSRWAFLRVAELRSRIDPQGGAAKPFWITEIGHPTDGCSNCSATNQNRFLSGYISGAQALAYVDGFFVYHFRDTCTSTSNKECWFGLTTNATTATRVVPKASYTTYQSAIAADPPDTTAPARPTGLAATVTLRWDANRAIDGVLDYVVYRDGAPIAHTTATSYTDSGFDPATAHRYAITARDHAGNESPVAP